MEIRLKIEQNMSKDEERKILDKLVKAFAANDCNYLTSLFTEDLYLWCSAQMRNDFPCDLMKWYLDAQKEVRGLEGKVMAANREAQSSKEGAQVIQNELDKVLGEASELEIAKDEEIAALKNRINELESDVGSADNMKALAELAVKSRGRQIVALKAKLYDAGEEIKGYRELLKEDG